MNKKLFFTGWLLFMFCMVSAQEYYPVNDGVKSINTNYTLFKNATLHPSPGKTISNGSMLIKDGKIVLEAFHCPHKAEFTKMNWTEDDVNIKEVK